LDITAHRQGETTVHADRGVGELTVMFSVTLAPGINPRPRSWTVLPLKQLMVDGVEGVQG
jgi:hypothetical protein